MEEKNIELTIEKIEDTPLSEKKTLTELKKEMEQDEDNLKKARKKEIIGYAIAGATFLAGTVAAYLTQNTDIGLWSLYSGAGISIGSSFFGKYVVGGIALKAYNSYDKYYEAVKETVTEEKDEKSEKGRNR